MNSKDILARIVSTRKERISKEGHSQNIDIPSLREVPLSLFPKQELICEIKSKSPSRGVFITHESMDPLRKARKYDSLGIKTLSVLTEQDYFEGSLNYLIAIKKEFPHLSILRKDFIIDKEDIDISFRAGADAVLLMASIISEEELQALYDQTKKHGLEALVEVHSIEEVDMVMSTICPTVLGINCRDLRTFSLNKLLPLQIIEHVKKHKNYSEKTCFVFESALFYASDIRFAQHSGCTAMLIGEAAVRYPHRIREWSDVIKQKKKIHTTQEGTFFWRNITNSIQKQKTIVKICGICNKRDADAAVEAGADILGFVLTDSQRQASLECIKTISLSSFPIALMKVGVIVGAPLAEHIRLVKEGHLDALQIHKAPENLDIEIPWYRAVQVKESDDISHVREGGSPRVLIDAYSEVLEGGTGKRLDDYLIRLAKKEAPLWIAGGLNEKNISDMIQTYKPELVDVASGIEKSPGIKDIKKMQRFIRESKGIKMIYTAKEYTHLILPLIYSIIKEAKSKKGYFGLLGGRYVPEVLHSALVEIEEAFFSLDSHSAVKNFWLPFSEILLSYVGRPTPLYYASNITNYIRSSVSNKTFGANIYIKKEGLAHTGAHKINNAIGQVLLAKKMGKKRIIAETGAGQHGVATATACAKLGLDCTIYMGAIDVKRQNPNVQTMQLLGAHVIPVESGQQTLKDAINEAIRDWIGDSKTTHYLIGSALGPAPFPDIVHCFQSIQGSELVMQCKYYNIIPHVLCACVGGGSNAMGFFAPFVSDYKHVHGMSPVLYAVEAGGKGELLGDHAKRLTTVSLENKTPSRKKGNARYSIVHGYKSYFLTNNDGQVEKTHSISAGLDYPGVGPHLARLVEEKKIHASYAMDTEVLEALKLFARKEGILFALESAHAAVDACKRARTISRKMNIIINMSGRGDKDLFITAPENDKEMWGQFLKDEIIRLGL